MPSRRRSCSKHQHRGYFSARSVLSGALIAGCILQNALERAAPAQRSDDVLTVRLVPVQLQARDAVEAACVLLVSLEQRVVVQLVTGLAWAFAGEHNAKIDLPR